MGMMPENGCLLVPSKYGFYHFACSPGIIEILVLFPLVSFNVVVASFTDILLCIVLVFRIGVLSPGYQTLAARCAADVAFA